MPPIVCRQVFFSGSPKSRCRRQRKHNAGIRSDSDKEKRRANGKSILQEAIKKVIIVPKKLVNWIVA